MLHKSRAIVLNTRKYGDSSLIVQAYTEEWGRKSFLLKGIRKAKKGTRANLFQPLFELDLDIYYRDNRELQWIREAILVHTEAALERDIVRSSQAIFISEILTRTIREEERNPALYDYISQSMDLFYSAENSSPSFHLLFMFHLSRYLGFYPTNNFSAERKFFDNRAGSFSSTPASAETQLEIGIGKLWYMCFDASYLTVDQLFTNHSQRNDFLDALLEFYRFHHDNLERLKSIDILRTVFS